jgi:hypothetical protein
VCLCLRCDAKAAALTSLLTHARSGAGELATVGGAVEVALQQGADPLAAGASARGPHPGRVPASAPSTCTIEICLPVVAVTLDHHADSSFFS